jgi:hypothetical protein
MSIRSSMQRVAQIAATPSGRVIAGAGGHRLDARP